MAKEGILCSSCMWLIHYDMVTQEMRELGLMASKDPFLRDRMWQRQAQFFSSAPQS